ncbi:uncharacterized protein LTR77_001002 [Saxophila tyrrhenica]|uniref:J domain-containing protein n=1 Tax=Saxophila tyrrhenica TaxID=1690608 RepID=A0AAV9PPY5_9PEZI|nr:hypothetical protein LTR77_001002 [Saxophila tyrrhenica]
MVKADVKHNYYADLEIPTSASIEDVRKAYRKLALLYHPDRNAGKEGECVPKFQAIQAANEILGDPTLKQKYDTDRRKAGLFPTGPTFNPRQGAPGNPYAASSAYPPPPRRTQPGGYQRPPPPTPGAAPGPPPSGADRFTNFPRAAPTARKDPVNDRANVFKAWQNLNNTQDRQQGFTPASSRPQPQPQPRPQPPPQQPGQRPAPPPRQETKMPTEEQIRAGMNYRANPRFDGATAEKNQSAWQAFNKQGPNTPKPGVSRTDSMRTPNKQGFNPNVAGSDEKPSASHYPHRNKSADFGRPHPSVRVPPPPQGPPPAATPTTPGSPISPNSRRPFADPTRPFHSRAPNDQVPYSEGNRNRTPYSSVFKERTDLGDNLRRSHSVRDTTKLGPEAAANRGRARSTSPLSRTDANGSSQVNGQNKQGPFMVYSDTEDSDDVRTPDGMNGSSKPTDQQRPESAPDAGAPDNRPKRVPKGPSRSRVSSSRPATASGTQSESEQPDMQQKSNSNNMYDHPLSSLYPTQRPNGQESRLHSTWRARRTWSNVGRWALPSSVNPLSGKASEKIAKSHRRPQQVSFVTGADPLYMAARLDEQNAYVRFQSDLRATFEQLPNNLDMQVFLSLASTARKGIPCGQPKLDSLLQRLLQDFSLVGTAQNRPANHASSANSFNFPNASGFSSSANGKSKSTEDIDIDFSPAGSSVEFNSEYFPPGATASRKPTPLGGRASRTPGAQARSATMDDSRGATPNGEVPTRPWGSDGTPKEMPTYTASGFDPEQWTSAFSDPSWTVPPPPPRQGSPGKGATPGARKPSQSRKASRPAMKSATKQPPAPHVVDVDEGGTPAGTDGAKEDFAAYDADAMDIDTPPANQPTEQAQEAPMPATDKGARLYSVPPSTWRQQQEHKLNNTPIHRNTSSATRRTERASTNDGTKLNTTLDDLRNVEPIARSAPSGTGTGLNDFTDLSSTLPFKSEAARPQSTPSLQQLDLPKVPTYPAEPVRASKTNWQNYARFFGEYCKAFHAFDCAMLQYFAGAEQRAGKRFEGGSGWLEQVGDTSGMAGEQVGFGSYMADAKVLERARMHWNVGWERYREGMGVFERVREGVRRKAGEGGLPEV